MQHAHRAHVKDYIGPQHWEYLNFFRPQSILKGCPFCEPYLMVHLP